MSINARIVDPKTPARTGDGRGLHPSNAVEPSRVGPGDLPPVSFTTANAAVAVAFLSDVLFPPAWPAAAAVLVGTNLKAIDAAVRHLGEGRVGLPVLYSSIAGMTLLTGQFIPWAAMSWMMRFWKHRYRVEFVTARDRLLAGLIEQPGPVRVLTADGAEVDRPFGRLEAGDVILLGAGDRVPVDGRVVQGCGLIDERVVCGGRGYRRGRPEDLVLAGSRIVDGMFQVQARGGGSPTRAAALTRMAMGAISHPPGERTPSRQGEAFADRVVLPTLAAAGVGLVVGGAPTALAVMRADYSSGPGLSYSLEFLRALTDCSRCGVVVREPAALGRFAASDVLLLEDHPCLEEAQVEVGGVRVFPGHDDIMVLRYAATALLDIDDERAPALREACRARKITVLRRIPMEHRTDITIVHEGRVIKVGNLGGERTRAPADTAGRSGPVLDSIMVGIDGQIAGLIEFRRSSRPRARTDLEALRVAFGGSLAIGLVSRAGEVETRKRAEAIGADFHRGESLPSDLVRLILGCRGRGLKVAFAGQCLTAPAAARAADVAISIDADPFEQADRNPGQILLLGSDLSGLGCLADAAREYQWHSKMAEYSAILPNLACAAGALIFGFSSLTNVAITNLGTLSTYARTARRLRSTGDPNPARHRSPRGGPSVNRLIPPN